MSRRHNTTADFFDHFEAITAPGEEDILLDELQRLARRKGITLRYFRRAVRPVDAPVHHIEVQYVNAQGEITLPSPDTKEQTT
jgi:hypothetical protein